jgi:hypothetical protein
MRRLFLVLLVLLVLLAAGWLALAASGELSLPWFTVDGGGGRSEGGELVLSGVIGQPEAGPPAEGGDFRLQGGFWAGQPGVAGEDVGAEVYLPLVVRDR